MSLAWRRVCDGCWHAFATDPDNPAAILEQNDFGRRLWTIEIVGRGRVVDGGSDCFSFAIAKQLVAERLAVVDWVKRFRVDPPSRLTPDGAPVREFRLFQRTERGVAWRTCQAWGDDGVLETVSEPFGEPESDWRPSEFVLRDRFDVMLGRDIVRQVGCLCAAEDPGMPELKSVEFVSEPEDES